MQEVYKANTQEGKQVVPETKEVVGGKFRVKEFVDLMLRRVEEVKGSRCMGAFQVCPDSRFVNEQDDEDTILILRAHPVTNLGWFVVSVLLLVSATVALMLGAFSAIPSNLLTVGTIAFYMGVFGFAFEKFLGWWFSVFIVTNERIVDLDFYNLMYRHFAYANLNHIEQPKMVSGGIIRSFFDYGDVTIPTAAEESDLEAWAVPFPAKVIRLVSELSEELEKRREKGE